MAARVFSPARLTGWLSGRSTLASVLRLSEVDRDDLLWHAEKLVATKAYEDAQRLYDLTLILWPDAAATAGLGRAVCLQLQGSLDEAEHAYDDILSTEPGNVHARVNRAEVYLLKGRVQAAGDDLARAEAALTSGKQPDALRQRVERLKTEAQKRAAPG
jgi:tetratricopeptide (TPR) repeat protein